MLAFNGVSLLLGSIGGPGSAPRPAGGRVALRSGSRSGDQVLSLSELQKQVPAPYPSNGAPASRREEELGF